MMPNPIGYAPNIENQQVTHTAADEVQINLKAFESRTKLNVMRCLMAALVLIWVALFVDHLLHPHSVDAAKFFGSTFKTALVIAIFALAEIAQRVSRDSLRVNLHGLERHTVTLRRERTLDVPWGDVGKIVAVRAGRERGRTIVSHLLIELPGRATNKDAPLRLMPDAKADDIEIVRGILERWRQNAAAATPPVR